MTGSPAGNGFFHFKHLRMTDSGIFAPRFSIHV